MSNYNFQILLNDINIPDNEIITKQNILRMQVIKDIGFKAHPEHLYRAMYTSSGLNRTTLSVSMPKLNYYEQEGQLKYHDLKILLIPSTKTITYGDGTTLDQNTILTYLNASDCYLSETSITPELFDTQEKECHLITFNNTIPAGTYKAILLQPAGTTYKLFEEFPQTIQSTSEITITGIQPDLTDDTTITPKTINTLTLKLETLQKGKITITIDSDYFTGKTFSSSDNKNKIRRWIKIMKGNETILPKTQITTTYDQNGNTITEVKEDYDNNKITITFPEYYLTGSTEMPTQKPQLPEGEYKIEIYQTNTASTPLTQKQINLIQMPFNLTFYHHDHLGTTRYITNENGEILHTTDTLAYGEELTAPYENDKDEVLNTITYTGHEKDYETGLTYMLARYYSQGYGTFISPDTFDLLGKINSLSSQTNDPEKLAQLETLMTNPLYWNKYTYCLDNPVSRVDKNGKFSLTAFVIGIAIVSGAIIYEIAQWMDERTAEAKMGQEIERQKAKSGDYVGAKRHYDNRMKKGLRSVQEVAQDALKLVFVAFPKKPIIDKEVSRILQKYKIAKVQGEVYRRALKESLQESMKELEAINQQLQNKDLSDSERNELKKKRTELQFRIKMDKILLKQDN